jgi:hypothetical protein
MNEAQKLLARMSDGKIEFLILRLGRYANRESKRLDWRTGNSNELPDGETDDSIVSKAFERVLSGKRKWNPENDPDFAKYMMDVIDSLLSHLVNSKDNTMFGPPPEEGSADEAAWHGASPRHGRKYERSAEWMTQTAASPEEELLQKKERAANKRAMELLQESIKNDAELVKIVEAIKEGCDKNGEIAKQTGIDIRDVEKAKKRLNRKIAGVNEQMMNSIDNEFHSEKRSNHNGRK